MIRITALCVLLSACIPANSSRAELARELKVHLVQANNDSAYAFVRAKFEPGEVADPWAVRFFDANGVEVQYFVWDSVTWNVAREGRADWGHRYALINHAPGDAPQVLAARGEKLRWAKTNLPELGAKLEAQDQAAAKAGDSVCAAIYLLRHRVPAFGKERLTLRIYPSRQVTPKVQEWKGAKVDERIAVRQGGLAIRDLPDRVSITWNGKDLFHYAGFNAGGMAGTSSHADASRPFAVEACEGIVTKLSVTGQTDGRRGSAMNWQSTYWMFPEGSCVALEGFSLDDTTDYIGGPQQLSLWQADMAFVESHKPTWDTPWWLHAAGNSGFVATHLFYGTPLTIGYGNNPFTINPEGAGKEPTLQAAGNQLTLSWSHALNDPAVMRVHAPQPMQRPSDRGPAMKPVTVRWQPKTDWLYRQYAVGLGEEARAAEDTLRGVVGAASGWIDRPVDEEAVATLLVEMMKKIPPDPDRAPTQLDQLVVVPMVLNDNAAAARSFLSRARNQAERADGFIRLIREHVKRGGKPSEGRHKDDPDGTRREGWTGNAAYHAVLLPTYLRVFDFFDLPYRHDDYRQALLRFADFTLDLLGGEPMDLDRWNATIQGEWPSRVVPAIPLMLYAHSIKPDEKYARAARLVFDDLMRLVERNRHGYFPAWTFTPGADKWDTVYNPISFERGIASFWSEEQLDLIGRERASHFVAAQARWMVYSGQLLDTLETDNVTAIRAAAHHEHTAIRNQIGLYLYDDFPFYRGLLGGLVDWSAATWQIPSGADPLGTGPYRCLELGNMGSSMLRWGLDVRPGTKWLEHKVTPLNDRNGFRLEVWNRLPKATPTVSISGKDLGLHGDTEVFQAVLGGPAFRRPAKFEVTRDGSTAILKISSSAKIRLSCRALWPGWLEGKTLIVKQLQAAGPAKVLADGIMWNDGVVEWHAAAGEYELTPAPAP